jgi:hypothetical protein
MPILIDKEKSIIDRQRAILRVGKIRMGERKTENAPGKQRDTFRFTSANRPALEMLKAAYGGKISEWAGHPGEYELDSKAGQISCIIDTSMSLDERFEKYDGKTRTHLCDGLNCAFIELRRGADKKISFCEDRGLVPCRCSKTGAGPDPENKNHCDMITTLKVILPDTGDIVLWEFASKGAIFNREVFGVADTIRQMGMKQAYCHLTINRLEKHRGAEVSKWGTARLTLDPNPPNFVATLLGRTPEAQARALMAANNGQGTAALAAPSSTGALPPSTYVGLTVAEKIKAHGLQGSTGADIKNRLRPGEKMNGPDGFLVTAHDLGYIGHDALINYLDERDADETESGIANESTGADDQVQVQVQDGEIVELSYLERIGMSESQIADWKSFCEGEGLNRESIESRAEGLGIFDQDGLQYYAETGEVQSGKSAVQEGLGFE